MLHGRSQHRAAHRHPRLGAGVRGRDHRHLARTRGRRRAGAAARAAGEAERRAETWASAFPGQFYLGIQRTGRPDDAPCLESTVDLALATGLPVVAGNDVRFIERDDFEAHEARVCIAKAGSSPTPAPEALQRGAVPEVPPGNGRVVRRSSRGARQRGRDRPPVQPRDPPRWQLPPRISGAGRPQPRRMARRAFAGGGWSGGLGAPRHGARPVENDDEKAAYTQRLEMELGTSTAWGIRVFSHRGRFHRMGEGASDTGRAGARLRGRVPRGLRPRHHRPRSAHHGLLFERFLNPERVSLPDFDVDFCMEGRDRVIDYVVSRYSADHVAQIITFGTMAAKAVVRDVGPGARPPLRIRRPDREAHPLRARHHPGPRARRGRAEGAVRGGRTRSARSSIWRASSKGWPATRDAMPAAW